MTVRIICDSACDLPKQIIEEYNLEVLPINVISGDNVFKDQVNIDPNEVYEGMRKGITYRTSQITPVEFEEVFEEKAKNDEECIYIGFSSGLSATFQSAILSKMAIEEKYDNFSIEVIDSKAASGGYGLIVYEIAKAAHKGMAKEDLISLARKYIAGVDQVFSVDDIEYLYRGGRVSRTSAVLGGMLNIKPILEVNEGKLVPIEKVRGRAKVLKRMSELVDERKMDSDLKNSTVVITHGDYLEGAEKLRDLIAEKYGTEEFIINSIGASIGAHVGPGTLALFFMKNKI